MEAIRWETTIEQDGRIDVPGVHVGDSVEVIVLLRSPKPKAYPLRGTPFALPHPFAPMIPESDWESSP